MTRRSGKNDSWKMAVAERPRKKNQKNRRCIEPASSSRPENFRRIPLSRRASADTEPYGPVSSESDGLTPRHESSRKRAVRRMHATAARQARGRRCCIAPLHSYFESHDLRCSSKKARTCSGSSAPRNSTPAGSGSGQKTLSGVGTFGGLASMISLLYKPIICLGPRFAPAPDAGDMLFVALTAQVNNGAECLNRIYRLTANAPISPSPGPASPIFHAISSPALSCGPFST